MALARAHHRRGVGRSADPHTGTYSVEVSLDDTDALPSGLVGQVRITTRGKSLALTFRGLGTQARPQAFEQSVALAHEVLAKGFLVTFKGEGHTAYGRSNECVSSVVDDFLMGGKLPSEGMALSARR